MDNLKEDNKLLAIFAKLKEGIYPSVDGKGYWETLIGDVSKAEADRLPYHTSWEWLMPVIIKILKVNDLEDLEYALSNGRPIEDVYKEVVKFIKLYNENNK